MIGTDTATNKIKNQDLSAFDLRLPATRLAEQDKRSDSRNYRTFKIKCKTYNTESDIFEISDGIAKNHSASGLYFETKNPFHPSNVICLSSNDPLLGKYDRELTMGVHAQIVWCKLLNTGFDPRYGVGVKYFEPIESHIESV